jgi:hypothetical protein
MEDNLNKNKKMEDNLKQIMGTNQKKKMEDDLKINKNEDEDWGWLSSLRFLK